MGSNWPIPLLVACSAAMLYWPSTSCGFVFDDQFAITGNRDTTNQSTTAEVFSHDFWGKAMYDEASHKSFRPLTILTFRLDWVLGGHKHDPAVFHTVNVALHAAVCAAVTMLSLTLFPDERWTAASGGLLFAVHPVHVEAVVGLVSRADLLCTLCFIGSMVLYLSMRKMGAFSAFSWLKLATLVYACALCKEIGIFLLPLCAAITCIQQAFNVQKVHKDVLGLVALGVPYAVLRTWVSTPPGQSMFSLSASTLQHSQLLRKAENPFVFLNGTTWWMSVGYLQAKYTQLLVWPWELCAEYSFNCIPAVESVSDPRNVATLFICLFVGGLAVFLVFLRPNSACTTLFLMTIIPYAPASNLLFRIGTLVAERLLYLPSVGFCILVAHSSTKITRICPRSASVGMKALVLILCALGAWRTHRRIPDWKDEASLFESALQVCPESAKLHKQVAQLRQMQGNFTGMKAELDVAKAIDPDFCDLSFQYGTYYAVHPTNPDFLAAAKHFQECLTCIYENSRCFAKLQIIWKALLAQPSPPVSLFTDIAETHLLLGNNASAALYFREAGVKQWKMSRSHKAAKKSLLRSLEANPLRCDAFYWLAEVYEDQITTKSSQKSKSLFAADCARWLGLQCTAGTALSFSPTCKVSPAPVTAVTALDGSWMVDADQKRTDSQNDLNSLSAATAFAERLIPKLRKASDEAYATLETYSQRSRESLTALDEEGMALTLAAARAEEVAADAYMLTFKASIRHGDLKPDDWKSGFQKYAGFYGMQEVDVENGEAHVDAVIPTKEQLDSASGALQIVHRMRQSAAVLYSRAGYKFLMAGAILEAETAFRKAVYSDVPVGTIDCNTYVLYSRVLAQATPEDVFDVQGLIRALLQQLASCPTSESTQAAVVAGSQLHVDLFHSDLELQYEGMGEEEL